MGSLGKTLEADTISIRLLAVLIFKVVDMETLLSHPIYDDDTVWLLKAENTLLIFRFSIKSYGTFSSSILPLQ